MARDFMKGLELLIPTETPGEAGRTRSGAVPVGRRTPSQQPTSGNYAPILILMVATGVLLWAGLKRPVMMYGAQEGQYMPQETGHEAYSGAFPGLF